MKIIYTILIILFTTTALIAQDWQELKSGHFIAYFIQNKYFTRMLLRKAEKDYQRIAYDLGYSRYSNFWTWSNRVKIYLYPNHTSYLEATGQPEWSEGTADYKKKEIHSYSGSRDFLNSVLPHEIAHLIFRDFIGFKVKIPLWLDEGVAQWEEQIKKERICIVIRDFIKKGVFLSFEDLMELDVRLLKDPDKIHIRTNLLSGRINFVVLDAKSLVDLYYLESASLVGFLIDRYGTESFTEFCRRLRDGEDLEVALRVAYTPHLPSLDELNDRWMEYLKEE
jgi:hypothetical protein